MIRHTYDPVEVKAIAEKYGISEGKAKDKIYQRIYNKRWREEHREERLKYFKDRRRIKKELGEGNT